MNPIHCSGEALMISNANTRYGLLVAWTMFIGFGVSLHAQEGLSTLRGTAHDTTGAQVPGVGVTVREVLTNISRTAETDAQGNYEMPALKAGTYQVTATLSGFKTLVVDGVL